MRGLFRFMARLALALPFIRLGWDAAQEPGGRVNAAAKLGVPQPDLAVRLNGYTMVAAGVTLALGILPRLSAVALVASLIPTTYAGHPFWEEQDPQKRQGQLIHFLKNVSMVGGLLLVALRARD
jgi:putative oxidoreductase